MLENNMQTGTPIKSCQGSVSHRRSFRNVASLWPGCEELKDIPSEFCLKLSLQTPTTITRDAYDSVSRDFILIFTNTLFFSYKNKNKE